MKYIDFPRLRRSLVLPMVFVILVISLHLVWYIFGLPRGDELIAAVKVFFDRYGILALFISSILEGALIIGFYYPGAFAIFLSVVLAGRDIPRVAEVVLIVSLGFVIGLTIDYILGKYGWHKILLKLGFRHEMDNAEKRLARRGAAAIFFTYWDVNLASFTATAAGVLRYRFGLFLLYSTLFILFWNTVWGTVTVFIGQRALELVSGNASYALSVITLWAVVIIVKHIVEQRKAFR